ncbi:DUF423 domain-containing protein [Labrenzia sp. PHM005]|uniref:DUF423 domain-containing protein n=1 Tax=Labrenzia sp. PHM005 TaxID=2590016 RepID=UPI0011401AFD|nr:DUF423 domain-containing protein [Labrenzia sp. PHM005]QDG77817.1 DUF423 domain-containing protein [Labrenzia sp. PHM005]
MTAQAPNSEPIPTSKLLRISIILSGLIGAAGVTLLALSAHADSSGLLKTSAQMLLFHAPVLLGLGLLAQARRVPFLPVVFLLMVGGIFLFSGDLIARVFVGGRLFAMAAPTGGMLIILGWIALALSAIRVRPK